MATTKSIGFSLTLPFISPLVLAQANTFELEGVTVEGEYVAPDKDWATREEQFYKSYTRETVDQTIIQEEGANDVTEAIADVPGVTVTSQGAFSKSITIRGLDGNRVSTIVDGVRIGNQGMTHTGAGEINMTDLDAVSSIDIIKGSPSVIFDPGASGGVVKVQTLNAPVKEGLKLKQKFAYDHGYGKKESTTMISGGTGKVGGLLIYSRDKADDYKIAGQDRDKALLINHYQLNQEMSPTPRTLKDLGYDAESLTLRGRADLGDETYVDVDFDKWVGKDIVSIHGNITEGNASIFQNDRMERERTSIGLSGASFRKLENIAVKYSNQQLYQLGSSETTLDSKNLVMSFDLPVKAAKLSLGAEAVLDEANTLVYSEQDYLGAFANVEYEVSDWIFNAGIRGNYWATRQKLLDGSNAAVASQLLGISGVTPEKTVSEPTWSLGSVYKLTDKQNISFNLSSTFRAPDLYERYAFGSGFVGGGLDMQPESGKHAELSWKYLNDNIAVSATAFVSRFDHFINTKTIRQISDYEGLQNCILLGKCDPANDDYNDQESDFFTQYIKYYNAQDVDNVGAEINAKLDREKDTITAGLSYNDFDADDIYVFAHAHPLKLDASYKYRFDGQWQPWVKVKGEYVFDVPEVKQDEFEPYFTTDLSTGIKVGDFTVNAGIKNLFDDVYRIPYSGVNALERSYFFNVSYDW